MTLSSGLSSERQRDKTPFIPKLMFSQRFMYVVVLDLRASRESLISSLVPEKRELNARRRPAHSSSDSSRRIDRQMQSDRDGEAGFAQDLHCGDLPAKPS